MRSPPPGFANCVPEKGANVSDSLLIGEHAIHLAIATLWSISRVLRLESFEILRCLLEYLTGNVGA